jgi:Ser/Thr protein kinase RdoA (MazF antagonist)
MFRRFASLQRRAATSIDALLADGCLDRRPEVLEVQLDALLADLDSVGGLTVQERSDLRDLGPVLKDSIRRLGGLGPPPTLVHGDLHPGNVAQLGAKLVYFDWTDACVAHPFVDLHSLRWETDESVRTALLEAYLDSWAGVASAERLREAALVATVVVPLHHAVSYWKLVGALEPSARRELDATHSFLREALLRAREL